LSDSVISLREHHPSVVDLDALTARALSEHSASKISVEPCAGGWRVTPSEMVGVFEVNGIRFIVEPKIPISNVFGLLDVDLSSFHVSRETFEYGSESDLLVGIVRLFAEGLDIALSQGLRHDYVERFDSLNSIRGRIEFASLARSPGIAIPTPCRFDEYTANIRVNQLLLSAIEVAVRVPGVPAREAVRLRRHLAAFEEVDHHRGSVDWVDTWVPNRMERHYISAVKPAALILRNHTTALSSGGSAASSFLVDMNRLVEKFIEDRIGRYLDAGLRLEPQKVRWLDVDRVVSYRPDLVVARDGHPIAVADVKYKAVDEWSEVENADIYQVHTYAQALGLDRAVLVTCTAGRPSNPRGTVVIGGTGVEIVLWPIDLSVPIPEINAQLLELALYLGDL
jgi:5-methylcytosine-specific restriction enzyme subunit McrC